MLSAAELFIVLALIVEAAYISELTRYIIKFRTPEEVYKIELNKIISNYGSYIQKIISKLDFNKYELVTLDSFNDMLEIRDTIQEPILMYEEKEELKTYFIIPHKGNMLYIYELKIIDKRYN